jgi:rhodanese-related sulfurtransferase
MQPPLTKMVPATLIILALLMLAGCSSDWGKKELQTEKIAATFNAEVQRGAYQVVTTPQLKEWMDAEKSQLIIDTMPFEASYKKNHIPGAKQMEFPIPELISIDEKMQSELLELLGPDKDRTIVFYCGFTKCTRSHNGAMWAVKLGYTQVYRMPGGIKGWKESGYPVGQAK